MNSPKSVYLAGPFFSDAQRKRTQRTFKILQQNPTINSEKIFQPEKCQYDSAEFGSFVWQHATYHSDIRQIDQADIVIAIMDYAYEEGNKEPDAGTAWECGYAVAHNKPVFVVRYHEDLPMNLMLNASATGVFNGEKDVKNLATYNFSSMPNKYVDLPII